MPRRSTIALRKLIPRSRTYSTWLPSCLQHKKYVGFLDDSIKFFRYGVAQFPKSSQMMVGLGVALYASNQYEEAVRVLCAAVDLDPTDRRPIQFLGQGYEGFS